MNAASARVAGLATGSCVRPIAGERVAGDACVVLGGARRALVALVDGLGHGPRAAEAANAFVSSVARSSDLDVEDILARAHRDLLRTRGAVAAIASIDVARGEVVVGGIGNVAAGIFRADGAPTVYALMVPGVIGSAFRAVRPQTFAMAERDMLVMHSDGVRGRFDAAPMHAMTAQAASEHVVRVAGKGTDDAACVVARRTAVGQEEAAPAEPRIDADVREVGIRAAGDAVYAALETRAYGARVGLAPRAQWEMSLVASELATNALKFAGSGTLTLRRESSPREAFVLEMTDAGPGIPDVAAAIADGFSEGALLSPERPRHPRQGLGVGLGTVHRMSDLVTIDSTTRGTRVVVHKLLR